MGLDMFLERAPRYKNYTAENIKAIEAYLDWQAEKASGSNYANCTMTEWCGVSEDKVRKEAIPFYEKYFTEKYYYWDIEHRHPHHYIFEQVGYWRKANAVHKWFVDVIQDGVDDCGYYEVDKDSLEELLNICKTIKDKCELVDGIVENGYSIGENYKKIPYYEQGKIVANPEIAEELLPTQSGFFFGDTNYDDWYMESINDTIDIITNVLETTDFDKEMIMYTSSW